MHGKPKIWVDADACPRAIKEILYRAAERTQVLTTFVANQHLHVPRSPHLRVMQVARGFDVADSRIVEQLQQGDLVVTQDIPLAAEVIAKGAHAMTPRGDVFDEENIQERLAMRNLMDQLRTEGMQTGGPAALGTSDRQEFANALDQWLTRHVAR